MSDILLFSEKFELIILILDFIFNVDEITYWTLYIIYIEHHLSGHFVVVQSIWIHILYMGSETY